MYDFLRRPVWILSHVLIALLVVVLIGLGLWQRSRYLEERDEQQRLETLARAEPVPYDEVLPASDTPSTEFSDEDRYRRVVVEGTYDGAAEVAILNRSRDGAPGAWVLTPLVQADGTAVPVVRGWIPYDPTADNVAPFPDSAPPEGPVEVTGNLQPSQERGSFGSTDQGEGTLRELSRVDLDRLQQQLPYDLEPAWVLLDGQTPSQPDGVPAPVELQTTDPSQNFSYMVQWWIFAAIAAVGYPLVLRVVARNKAKGDQTPDDPDEDDDEIPWAPGLGPSGEERRVASDP